MGRRREDTKGSCTEQSDVQLFSSGCSCSSWLSTGGSSPWDWQHQTTALVFSSRGDTALQTHLDWHWAGGKSTGNASLHCRERELLHLPSRTWLSAFSQFHVLIITHQSQVYTTEPGFSGNFLSMEKKQLHEDGARKSHFPAELCLMLDCLLCPRTYKLLFKIFP